MEIIFTNKWVLKREIDTKKTNKNKIKKKNLFNTPQLQHNNLFKRVSPIIIMRASNNLIKL